MKPSTILLVSLLAAILLAGCSHPPDEENGEPRNGDPGGPEAVTIQGFAFGPATIDVPAGTSVTWTNEDSAPHTATADDQSWDTGSLGEGESGSVTFDEPGEYPYHCAFHDQMSGTVTVTA